MGESINISMSARANESSISFGDYGPAPTRTAARPAAQGGSQNVNNTLGDIPSVKLYAPPGGASSISFGGGEPVHAPLKTIQPQAPPAPAPAPVYAAAPAPAAYAAPAAPAAPAQGHFDVGAKSSGRTACRAPAQGGSQNVGNTIGDVPSVKLHAPPGGSSSICFGGGYDAPPARAAPAPAPAPVAPPAPVYAAPVAAAAPAPMAAPASTGFEVGGKPPARTAARACAQGGSQNVGNTIGDVPSVKLHAPPGGSSSISFG